MRTMPIEAARALIRDLMDEAANALASAKTQEERNAAMITGVQGSIALKDAAREVESREVERLLVTASALTRLCTALVPLIDSDGDKATRLILTALDARQYLAGGGSHE